MLAQWAIESAWGAKPVGHANYLGMKMAERHAMCCTVETEEVVDGKRVKMELAFADFPSLADSCKDYAWLITQGSPYRAAWQKYQSDHNLPDLFAAVAGKYAIDPNYTNLLGQIACQENVARAIAAARQETNYTV
jgi:flagellum-specific peptidoglycan hydrolase FlgJ